MAEFRPRARRVGGHVRDVVTATRTGTALASHVRELAPQADPLASAVALMRTLGAPSVLYERAGEWTLGAGIRTGIVVRRDGVHVRHEDGRTEIHPPGDDPLQVVHGVLAAVSAPGGRAYGWVGFELAAALLGAARVGPPDEVLAHVIVPPREIRLSAAGTTLLAVRASDLDGLETLVRTTRPEPVADPWPLVADRPADPDYRRSVAAAVAGIRDGALAKVILSRPVPVPVPVDLPSTYLAGRRGNTPARSFLLDLPGLRAAGFSPETVVEVAADGTVTTQPLAGTRARHGDPETDAALRCELLADTKEIVEHARSVKLAQDEMNALCDQESVHVSEFMQVCERGSVQHLGSRLRGRLRPGVNGWHALRGLSPAITVSGIPKREACAWIGRAEAAPRGLYGGAVVIADADGALDAALVLRTVVERDGRAVLRAGAGIVAESDPDREFEETCEKLRSVSRFLVPDGPGETA